MHGLLLLWRRYLCHLAGRIYVVTKLRLEALHGLELHGLVIDVRHRCLLALLVRLLDQRYLVVLLAQVLARHLERRVALLVKVHREDLRLTDLVAEPLLVDELLDVFELAGGLLL